MPANIETFVKTLETEGVEAGKKAAKEIENQAKQKAQEIIDQSKAQAETIIKQANSEAEKIQTRTKSSLELATRDAIFKLAEKLSGQLNALVNLNVEKALNDEQTLVNVLREVIPAYAKADADSKINAEINISKDLKSKLVQSALAELSNSLKEKNAQLDVRFNLAKAGFEYKIEGSTVEVSTESVTSLLADMIDPELRKFLEKGGNNRG